MQIRTIILLASLAGLIAAGCQGGGSHTPPPAAAQTPPPTTTAPGTTMGPGMHQNFGMMYHNLDQMHRMSQGYMSPEHYNQMMGMMGQMGGMMGQMGGPRYTPEMERQHREQLQEMHQQLSSMEGRSAASGARIFANHCASCHPQGGNVFNPERPLAGAPQLDNFNSFQTFVRQGRGVMPAFPPSRISASQLRELYRYVVSAWGTR
jgi:cytochrome c6